MSHMKTSHGLLLRKTFPGKYIPIKYFVIQNLMKFFYCVRFFPCRITAVEDDTEDHVAHESDALLSTVPPPAPVYSPPSTIAARDEPVTMSSCSTQTGNPETRRSMRSLLSTPVTVDAGTQVTSLSDGYASSPSVSVERLDRPTISMIPPVLRDTSMGRLRESFIGLRERGKEDPVIGSVSKPSCALERRPSRSGSRDRSET